MNFNAIMHVSFFTDNLEQIRDFYENKLGLKPKMIVRYEAYRNKPDSGFYQRALTNPQDICIIYIEVAPGQFLEFFPKAEGQREHAKWNERLGYSHFSLTVDDIQQTREDLVAKGVIIDIEPKIGNSHTWQMWIHDPDGNMIEIMQYTADSFQLVGNIEADSQ